MKMRVLGLLGLLMTSAAQAAVVIDPMPPVAPGIRVGPFL